MLFTVIGACTASYAVLAFAEALPEIGRKKRPQRSAKPSRSSSKGKPLREHSYYNTGKVRMQGGR